MCFTDLLVLAVIILALDAVFLYLAKDIFARQVMLVQEYTECHGVLYTYRAWIVLFRDSSHHHPERNIISSIYPDDASQRWNEGGVLSRYSRIWRL